MNYCWSISQLECHPQKDGKQNVVSAIHWRRRATDGALTVDTFGSEGIALDPAAPFTPFESLTKKQVEGWLESAMGSARVAEIDAELSRQIESQRQPPVARLELPWG
jgi:hypothetical protein